MLRAPGHDVLLHMDGFGEHAAKVRMEKESALFAEAPALRAIGAPLLRKEDLRLLTGSGRFSDDEQVHGQAHAAMVRSPHPHARIVRVDTRRARGMQGGLGV